MEIAFHIGAHRTDEDRLVRTLRRNADRLTAQGVAVPPPDSYRDVLGEVTTRLRGETADEDTRDALLESMLQGADPARLVLSNDSFVSTPARAIEDGVLYPRIHKTAWLRALFPGHAASFHLAIRNPATLIPAIVRGRKSDMLNGTDPRSLRWSEVIGRLCQANPGAEVVVWCNEDIPLLWPEVLHSVTGTDPEAVKLNGHFDVLRQIMTNEGLKRLRIYTKAHPPATEATRRRVVTAFLDKFALPEAIEDEIDMPGWTEELVDEMTQDYEADIARISTLPGVRLLSL